MEEKEVFKVTQKEVQQAVIDRVLMRIEESSKSFKREEEMQAAKKAYLAAQEEVEQETQNGEKTVLN